ncbi:hypothetical protein D8B45_05735 [Candidatus Gracilibacteria bacterium]|nr:MAG: hypothetical protein D8B45_05735 [Candidatus Gracilibacteria bacterium]
MQENMYLPSSSERKRVITAYLLVGVLFFSAKEDLTVYEYFHFRQVLGRYSLNMLLLLVWLMIFWIPILGWLPFFFVLGNLVLYVVFVMQARRGQYLANLTQENKWKTLYADIGGWILSLFDIKKRVYGDISLDTPVQMPQPQVPDQSQGNQ